MLEDYRTGVHSARVAAMAAEAGRRRRGAALPRPGRSTAYDSAPVGMNRLKRSKESQKSTAEGGTSTEAKATEPAGVAVVPTQSARSIGATRTTARAAKDDINLRDRSRDIRPSAEATRSREESREHDRREAQSAIRECKMQTGKKKREQPAKIDAADSNQAEAASGRDNFKRTALLERTVLLSDEEDADVSVKPDKPVRSTAGSPTPQTEKRARTADDDVALSGVDLPVEGRLGQPTNRTIAAPAVGHGKPKNEITLVNDELRMSSNSSAAQNVFGDFGRFMPNDPSLEGSLEAAKKPKTALMVCGLDEDAPRESDTELLPEQEFPRNPYSVPVQHAPDRLVDAPVSQSLHGSSAMAKESPAANANPTRPQTAGKKPRETLPPLPFSRTPPPLPLVQSLGGAATSPAAGDTALPEVTNLPQVTKLGDGTIVCPLPDRGLSRMCIKVTHGVHRARNMQNHIRRVHPEDFVYGMSASEDSIQRMFSGALANPAVAQLIHQLETKQPSKSGSHTGVQDSQNQDIALQKLPAATHDCVDDLVVSGVGSSYPNALKDNLDNSQKGLEQRTAGRVAPSLIPQPHISPSLSQNMAPRRASPAGRPSMAYQPAPPLTRKDSHFSRPRGEPVQRAQQQRNLSSPSLAQMPPSMAPPLTPQQFAQMQSMMPPNPYTSESVPPPALMTNSGAWYHSFPLGHAGQAQIPQQRPLWNPVRVMDGHQPDCRCEECTSGIASYP